MTEPTPEPPLHKVHYFRRMPQGGTVYRRVAPPVSQTDWFRRMPNGGGTVFVRPTTDEESHD